MLPQYRTGDMQQQLQGVARRLTEVSDEEFTEVMRINALRSAPAPGFSAFVV